MKKTVEEQIAAHKLKLETAKRSGAATADFALGKVVREMLATRDLITRAELLEFFRARVDTDDRVTVDGVQAAEIIRLIQASPPPASPPTPAKPPAKARASRKSG